MILRLIRIEADTYGTFGILFAREFPPMASCERPWIEWAADGRVHYPYGRPYESCVPAGEYELHYRNSAKHGWSWWLRGDGVHLDNPNLSSERFACLIHPANYPSQVQGCIALGSHIGQIAGRYGVANSARAVQKFMTWLPVDEQHRLTIEVA